MATNFWKQFLEKRSHLYYRMREFVEVYRWVHRKYREEQYRRHRQDYWEALHQTFDDLAAVGPSLTSSDVNQHVYSQSKETFIEFLRENGIELKNKRVLEIGIGTGFFTQLIADSLPQVLHGIDISPTAVSKVRASLKTDGQIQIKLWCTDIAEGLDSDQSYDWVFMIDVAQHITNHDLFKNALENIQRKLAPGGGVVLTSYLTRPQGRTHEDFNVHYWTIESYEKIFLPHEWCYLICPKIFNSKQLFAICPKKP